MQIHGTIPTDPESLARGLEGFIEASRKQWREHPEWRPLYETKIRYQRQPPPERWQTSAETRAKGNADCDQMVVDRIAELRERRGELAAVPYVYQTGSNSWHAQVRRADGTIEDPSRIQKAREQRGWPMGKLGDEALAVPSEASVKLRDLADGRKAGKVSWQTATARFTIETVGDTPTQATERALAAARQVMAHPLLKSFVPPQAVIAMAAATKLLSLAKAGRLEDAARRMKGPALRLARRLLG